MKLSEIRAAIKARADSTKVETPVLTAPEAIAQPAPVTIPVKPQIVKSITRKKKNATTNVVNENDTPTTFVDSAQNITPVQVMPAEQPLKQQKREPRTKTSKSKSTDSFINEDIETIVRKYLKPNQDYAVIPNTKKPTLLKGGAEKLAAIFSFTTSCSIVNRIEHFDYDNPAISFVQYEAKVIVYNCDGTAVSEGYGSCNSSESKFLKQPFANRINTVLKISKKRAYVDAILTATSASGIFTQDMEDIANFQDSSN